MILARAHLVFRIRDVLRMTAVMAALSALTSCSIPPNTPVFAATSRFHAQNVPDGSLRAGEVVVVGSRQQIRNFDWAYKVLIAAGIPDAEIRDGSVVFVRVFCCGGPNEEATILMGYVPQGKAADLGDIVEIWSGQMVEEGDPPGPWPNTITRVLEDHAALARACRWDPDNPQLWMRVIRCDWMPSEGWVQQVGLYPVWIKPIAASTPPI